MNEKVTIVFTHDPEPKQGGNFKAGDKVSLVKSSADRWIRRGKAVTESEFNAMNAEIEDQKAASPEEAKAEAKAKAKK